MFVTYTVKNYQFKETSEGRGIVSYLIVDKHSNKRKISALAHVNKRGKIKSIRPINKRELPLLQILVKSSLNEKIEVDFTEYNTANPRDEDAKHLYTETSKAIPVREVKNEFEVKDHTIYSIDDIGENKFRLFQMVALGALVLAAIMFIQYGFFGE
jgi:hypothetical protein